MNHDFNRRVAASRGQRSFLARRRGIDMRVDSCQVAQGVLAAVMLVWIAYIVILVVSMRGSATEAAA